MSRGPGRVQEAILDALTDGQRSHLEFHEVVCDAHLTGSETRALNRAVRGLLDAGLVIDTFESTTQG